MRQAVSVERQGDARRGIAATSSGRRSGSPAIHREPRRPPRAAGPAPRRNGPSAADALRDDLVGDRTERIAQDVDRERRRREQRDRVVLELAGPRTRSIVPGRVVESTTSPAARPWPRGSSGRRRYCPAGTCGPGAGSDIAGRRSSSRSLASPENARPSDGVDLLDRGPPGSRSRNQSHQAGFASRRCQSRRRRAASAPARRRRRPGPRRCPPRRRRPRGRDSPGFSSVSWRSRRRRTGAAVTSTSRGWPPDAAPRASREASRVDTQSSRL